MHVPNVFECSRRNLKSQLKAAGNITPPRPVPGVFPSIRLPAAISDLTGTERAHASSRMASVVAKRYAGQVAGQAPASLHPSLQEL